MNSDCTRSRYTIKPYLGHHLHVKIETNLGVVHNCMADTLYKKGQGILVLDQRVGEGMDPFFEQDLSEEHGEGITENADYAPNTYLQI